MSIFSAKPGPKNTLDPRSPSYSACCTKQISPVDQFESHFVVILWYSRTPDSMLKFGTARVQISRLKLRGPRPRRPWGWMGDEVMGGSNAEVSPKKVRGYAESPRRFVLGKRGPELALPCNR